MCGRTMSSPSEREFNRETGRLNPVYRVSGMVMADQRCLTIYGRRSRYPIELLHYSNFMGIERIYTGILL